MSFIFVEFCDSPKLGPFIVKGHSDSVPVTDCWLDGDGHWCAIICQCAWGAAEAEELLLAEQFFNARLTILVELNDKAIGSLLKRRAIAAIDSNLSVRQRSYDRILAVLEILKRVDAPFRWKLGSRAIKHCTTSHALNRLVTADHVSNVTDY